MSLELTILGCAGSHPGPARLCSGYLVRTDTTALMVDAGNGSTANLQRFVALRDLAAIVISHRHVDHCIDLVGAYYALRFDPTPGRRLPLYAAAEVHATLTGLLSSDSEMTFDDVFDHTEVGEGSQITVGDAHLSFARSVHPPPTVSTRIEVAGSTLVYSGDSAGGPDLVQLARGADLLLCEATWAGSADDYPPGIHLTATGAGEVASAAGVGRLVLTHIAGGTDREQVLREAQAAFDGPVELAEDLAVYRLP